MKLRWNLPAAVFAVGFLLLFYVRGYPWRLAFLAAAAVAACVYAILRTIENMRQSVRQDAGVVRPALPSSHGAPGEEAQGGGEQQMGRAAEGEAGEQQDHPGGEREARSNEAEP